MDRFRKISLLITITAFLYGPVPLYGKLETLRKSVRGKKYFLSIIDADNDGRPEAAGISSKSFHEILFDADNDGIVDEWELYNRKYAIRLMGNIGGYFQFMELTERKKKQHMILRFAINENKKWYVLRHYRFKKMKRLLSENDDSCIPDNVSKGLIEHKLLDELTKQQDALLMEVKEEMIGATCKRKDSGFEKSYEEIAEAITRVIRSAKDSRVKYLNCLAVHDLGNIQTKMLHEVEQTLQGSLCAPKVECQKSKVAGEIADYNPEESTIRFLKTAEDLGIPEREDRIHFYADTFFHEMLHHLGYEHEAFKIDLVNSAVTCCGEHSFSGNASLVAGDCGNLDKWAKIELDTGKFFAMLQNSFPGFEVFWLRASGSEGIGYYEAQLLLKEYASTFMERFEEARKTGAFDGCLKEEDLYAQGKCAENFKKIFYDIITHNSKDSGSFWKNCYSFHGSKVCDKAREIAWNAMEEFEKKMESCVFVPFRKGAGLIRGRISCAADIRCWSRMLYSVIINPAFAEEEQCPDLIGAVGTLLKSSAPPQSSDHKNTQWWVNQELSDKKDKETIAKGGKTKGEIAGSKPIGLVAPGKTLSDYTARINERENANLKKIRWIKGIFDGFKKPVMSDAIAAEKMPGKPYRVENIFPPPEDFTKRIPSRRGGHAGRAVRKTGGKGAAARSSQAPTKSSAGTNLKRFSDPRPSAKKSAANKTGKNYTAGSRNGEYQGPSEGTEGGAKRQSEKMQRPEPGGQRKLAGSSKAVYELRKFITGDYEKVLEALKTDRFISVLIRELIQIVDHRERKYGSREPLEIYTYSKNKNRLALRD